MSLKKYEGHTLIMYNSTRLLIPTNARRHIANELHKAHSGLMKMMKTATQLYYWPNMRTLLESVVQKMHDMSKGQTNTSKDEDERDTSVRRTNSHERARL